MFHGIEPLPPECIKFFTVFQRLEYALKREGFVHGEVGGDAKASWKKFAETLPKDFFQKIESQKLAPTLVSNPPRKERRLTDTKVGYKSEPEPPLTSSVGLFSSIRVLRNNLFHGGKIPYLENRDPDLINDALAVLREALRTNEKVRQRFGAWYVD